MQLIISSIAILFTSHYVPFHYSLLNSFSYLDSFAFISVSILCFFFSIKLNNSMLFRSLYTFYVVYAVSLLYMCMQYPYCTYHLKYALYLLHISCGLEQKHVHANRLCLLYSVVSHSHLWEPSTTTMVNLALF